MADNPPSGAILDYFVKSAKASPLVLEILDDRGQLVRRYSSDDKPPQPDLRRIQTTPDWVPVHEAPSASAGMHRFVWDLHYELPEELASSSRGSRGSVGPWAPPGRYTARVSHGGKTLTRSIVVTKDPRVRSVTDADLVRQYELARDVQAERVRVSVALRQAGSLRKQIAAAREGRKGKRTSALDALERAIDLAAGPPTRSPSEEYFDPGGLSPTSLRRLSRSLSDLQAAVESADAAPTPDALAGLAERRKLVDQGLARWKALLATDVPKAGIALDAK
jgi:hypothetical protein